jgi:cytosine/adenosine deaminase-related metal-dependent hydrolase
VVDLLITGGVTPAGPRDIAVVDGTIAAIGPELPRAGAKLVLDADGCFVLPGIVDPHVHVSGRFGRPAGFAMLVRAGVTAALDLAGDPGDLAASLPSAGCGLTVGALFPLIPGDTVSGAEPGEREIETILERELGRGALGLKVLGGHFPLTPESTRAVIEACARRSAYCAVHAGTTATGSDVGGVEELVELAAGLPVHVAHVNSYCRGQLEAPAAEAARALAALSRAPAAWSESYLSLLNGAEARCEDGVPLSGVVRTCLRLGGYEQSQSGVERAIADGWGRVQAELDDEVGFVDPAEGLERFRAAGTDVGISFPVNPPAAALALALARDAEHAFAVDALGSDGGSIPRNTTLRQGMGLVRGGFLSLAELAHKASRAPADRLGLAGKGRLEPGADADLIVVDADGGCRNTVIGGRVVVRDGAVVERARGTVLRPPA